MNDQKDRIEITELFMAKAGNDWSRCFHGTIKRGHDIDGNPKVWGKIKVHETIILASANDQWELGEKLDEMVLIVLDYAQHIEYDFSSNNPETKYLLN